MTFLQLQQHTFRLLRDPNQTKYSLAIVKDWLNESERQYCANVEYYVRLSTSLSSTAATREYTLPSDFLHEIEVRYDNEPLSKIEMRDILHSDGDHSGDPCAYYIEAGKIGLEPIPSASSDTITLVYVSMGGSMSLDADTPVIPVEHQMLLVYYACILACIEGDDTRINHFAALWQGGIDRAKQDMAKKKPWPTLLQEDEYNVERYNHDVEGIL